MLESKLKTCWILAIDFSNGKILAVVCHIFATNPKNFADLCDFDLHKSE